MCKWSYITPQPFPLRHGGMITGLDMTHEPPSTHNINFPSVINEDHGLRVLVQRHHMVKGKPLYTPCLYISMYDLGL